VGAPGSDKITLGGSDRYADYRTALGERLAVATQILETLVRQRPELTEDDLADVRERLVARAVAGAERYKPCACVECWAEREVAG
jgi:hypothetical protein